MPHIGKWAALIAAAVLAVASDAPAQAWRGPDGTPSPPSESRKQVEGFGAMVLVTPDLDWQAKWDTPPDVIPHFRESDSVARGETVAILIFLSSPKIVDGAIDTKVDLRVLQPDGAPQFDQKAAPCLTGPAKEIGANVLLCESSIGFFASPTDPVGEYTVEVVVRDLNRGVEVPLRTRFRMTEADPVVVAKDSK
jgi:hypothetical protein